MSQDRHYFSVGNIISETITLYTENISTFWLPYIIVSVPVSLFVEYMTTHFFDGFVIDSALSLLSSAVSAAVGLFIIIKGLNRYRDKSESFGENMKKAEGLIINYLLLQLLILLGVAGGMLLLIVPGIIFSLRWTLSPVIFVDERLGIRESMKRSRNLTEGYKGDIFVIYLIVSLIGFSVFAIFSFIASALTEGAEGFFQVLSAIGNNPLSRTSMLYSVVSSLLSPLYPLLSIVMYYNIKKQREGFVAEELADSFLSDKPEDAI